jgi:hypothetical protein
LRALTLIAGLALTLAAAAPARAQQYGERIIAFHADVTVHADASMDVVETIRVAAGGQAIDHGINRDFPTRQRGLVNRLFPFEVRSVTRDGQPEPFTVSRGGDAARVQIGDAGAHLSIGLHTYVISYRTDRQLRYFADHDELYWNVTGTDSTLPIDEASAEVHLPPAAAARMHDLGGYTGAAGSKDARLTAERRGDVAVFSTTQPLGAREGLTIVVAWPKGIVHEPTADEARLTVARDNAMLGVGAACVAALAAFVFGIGRGRRRRDEQARAALTVVTAPPEGLSPAALHSVTTLGFDDSTFTAGLVSLADKGLLTISRAADGTFTLARGNSPGSTAGELPPEERALLDALFRGGETLTLTRESSRAISSARAALFKGLREANGDRYIVRRGGAAMRGLALAVLAAAALAASGPGEARLVCAFLTLWVSFWTIAVVALLKATAAAWRKASQSRYAPGALIGALFATLFAAVFGGAELGVLAAYGAMASPIAAALFAGVLLMGVRLVGWLREPTPLGVRVRAAASAYRDYLVAARPSTPWSAAQPPPFAYALALGVAPAWTPALIEAGAVTAPTPMTGPFRPFWWRHDTWDHSSLSDLGTSLPSAVAGATSSSSSSGSGGSGSSGGGGGGGGVSGW